MQSECLSCWGNLGGLVDVGKGAVAVGQSVLHSIVGTDCAVVLTVLLISVKSAPGLEENRHGARVVGSDVGDNSLSRWQLGVVDHRRGKSRFLALALDDHNIPVSLWKACVRVCG